MCFHLLVIYFFSFFFFSCTLISVASSLLLLISMLYKSLFQLLTGLMKYFTICGAVIKGDEFLNSGEFCKNGKKTCWLKSYLRNKSLVRNELSCTKIISKHAVEIPVYSRESEWNSAENSSPKNKLKGVLIRACAIKVRTVLMRPAKLVIVRPSE